VAAWYQDIAGGQFNPAILDAVESVQIEGSYVFLSDERRFITAQTVIPVGQYLVGGFLFRNITVGQIELRDNDGYLGGHFDARENALDFCVAGRIPWNISLGAKVRYLGQRFKGIDNGRAYGVGFDAGALWRPNNMISVGLSGLNIGSYLWWKTGRRDPVLSQARAGACATLLENSLLIELDIAKTVKQPLEIAGGVQYSFIEILFVRAGVNTSVNFENRHSRDPDLSGGIGVRYSFFGCDYGITVPTEYTSEMMSHAVSLLLRFKPPKVF
jgi:hypothetical protein